MTVSAHSWSQVLTALVKDGYLDEEGAAWAMSEIMSGEATPAQIAGFAIAMTIVPESVDAVTGLVRTMLANAAPAHLDIPCVDIVGTGGDQRHTVNISTMASLVAAAAGIPVAKHGNRAASSSCGAADLLEQLGIRLDLDGKAVVRCIQDVGIGFFFAPQFHSGLRFAGPPRKELGVPTIFNFLGPLSNPASPRALAVGCADSSMAPVLAEVMARRGVSAMVFRGDDGLDELTTTTTSALWLVTDGTVRATSLDPTRLGISPSRPGDLVGGLPPHNAAITRLLLEGARSAVRDTVLLNCAAAIVAFEGIPATDDALYAAFEDGIGRAATAIDAGNASEVLARWVEASNA
ncbi:MAG: anthranilate phosphoribosyltransferase [Antricoccus sp.]